ncbi:hypothetical protein GCM10007304_22040 [Rhodococcoides trifolii]|uniref:Tat pathway signal protein n=1 Tax=Rhodococcoides trifolii TaxID=908250 RepID=A0A917D279_9NOCA|nr:hypothetical protein [Rhodococcus trifolii]GGG07614.1 hypothetical protein GCM10007304_22040 [Rhodococcus trifolii]
MTIHEETVRTWHDERVRSPTTSPSLSRRALLRLAGGAAVVAASAGCAANDEPAAATPDALLAEATRARTDAADATAVALARPELAGALGVVAAERTAHADALTAEVARLTPPPTSSAPPTTDTATAADPSAADAAPPLTLDELRANLTESSTSAANLARTLSGYRAGLLGSVSAACSVHVSAVLA